jgi:hypothetical protein
MVFPGSVSHIISVNCFSGKSKGCSVEIDNGLLEKYRVLLAENSALREENEILKARLGITDPSRPNPHQDPENHLPLAYDAPDLLEKKPPRGAPPQLAPAEKIQLFMSLFKGREDVYAKRWQNREGRAGYAPATGECERSCQNPARGWRDGLRGVVFQKDPTR